MFSKRRGSYRDLDVWRIAPELAVKVHEMTLKKLPRFEVFEEGNQIHRSSKSVSSNIVEGFGGRRYKNDFIKFLMYILPSCDESRKHLEFLFETGSLKDKALYEDIYHRYNNLGRRINIFIKKVNRKHLGPKENAESVSLLDN